MTTYPEMNAQIVGILRTGNETSQYAAARIEELEAEVEQLRGIIKRMTSDEIGVFVDVTGELWAFWKDSIKALVGPASTACEAIEMLLAAERKEKANG